MYYSKKAMSLIDVLVTLAIIIVLFLTALPAYKNMNRKSEIAWTAYTLASNINAAKTYAQYPSDGILNGAGYCVEYNKEKNSILLSEVTDATKIIAHCTNGKILQSQELSTGINIKCDSCKVGFLVQGNGQKQIILGADDIFTITALKNTYNQSVKIDSDGNIDVGT